MMSSGLGFLIIQKRTIRAFANPALVIALVGKTDVNYRYACVFKAAVLRGAGYARKVLLEIKVVLHPFAELAQLFILIAIAAKRAFFTLKHVKPKLFHVGRVP